MPNCIHGVDSRFCGACANPQRAAETRRRNVQLRAEKHEPQNDAEREAYEAVYAYEEALSKQNGKKTTASRTWPMIKKKGIIAAVEFIVTRKDETPGYRLLVGMEDMAFEAVVLRHPDSFSAEAAAASKERLDGLRGGVAQG